MGVKGLYSYIGKYKVSIDPRNFSPKRIGVDAMSLLYKHKGNFENILILLQSLQQVGHRIFFVFDGKPPVEKEREVQARKDQKSVAAGKLASLEAFLESSTAETLEPAARAFLEQSLERLQRQSWHMTRDLRQKFQGELWKAGIPYVKSISEADDVLVDLYNGGKLDVILTTDMDYLLSGVQHLWVPTHRGLFQYEEISLDRILEGESLSVAGLADAGLLCGTEERLKAKGIPCATAFNLIRHYGSLEGVLNGTTNDKVIREMFPDRASVESARATLAPKNSYERIRPDHLERVKDFLTTL